jgi:hypothetical protein
VGENDTFKKANGPSLAHEQALGFRLRPTSTQEHKNPQGLRLRPTSTLEHKNPQGMTAMTVGSIF